MPRPSKPLIRRDAVVDDYHGQLVPDPYRWLEDTDSAETLEWITAQNAVTRAFLASVDSREQIRVQLAALWDYPRFDVPFERNSITGSAPCGNDDVRICLGNFF